jgi:hypothetical protein
MQRCDARFMHDANTVDKHSTYTILFNTAFMRRDLKIELMLILFGIFLVMPMLLQLLHLLGILHKTDDLRPRHCTTLLEQYRSCPHSTPFRLYRNNIASPGPWTSDRATTVLPSFHHSA